MWVAENRRSLVLWLLRADGPATTNGLTERLKAWAERDGRPWWHYERHSRHWTAEAAGVSPGYQHFYQQLQSMKRRLLVVQDGKGDYGAHLWRATTRDERVAMLDDIKRRCEPTDEDRALAADLSVRIGHEVRLVLDEKPTYGHGWVWEARVVVSTGRGDIVRGVPNGRDGNNWASAIAGLVR